jgi:hypothetical protein
LGFSFFYCCGIESSWEFGFSLKNAIQTDAVFCEIFSFCSAFVNFASLILLVLLSSAAAVVSVLFFYYQRLFGSPVIGEDICSVYKSKISEKKRPQLGNRPKLTAQLNS